MDDILPLIERYWLRGLLALLIAFVVWRLLRPVFLFWRVWFWSRFREGNNQPWNWGKELNLRGEGQGRERCLVVFVHGLYPLWPEPWRCTLLIDHFDDVLQSRFINRDYLLFRYHGAFWSSSEPATVAAELRRQITAATEKHHYDAILLTAHSFGGLLVQQAVLDAGDDDWYPLSERIVLLASPNRGLSANLFLHQALARFARTILDHRYNFAWLRFGHLALAGFRGATWVSELRMRWATTFSAADPPPLTFQIVGDRDSLVSIADDDDLRRNASFHRKLVPQIGHRDFTLRMSRGKSPAAITELRERIAAALTERPA